MEVVPALLPGRFVPVASRRGGSGKCMLRLMFLQLFETIRTATAATADDIMPRMVGALDPVGSSGRLVRDCGLRFAIRPAHSKSADS